MSKKIKIILFSVLGLVVFLFIAKVSGVFGKTESIKVTVEKVKKRTITEIITANGKIQPETEVKISSDVSGEIVELRVKEGDEVKEGDLLLKIRPDIYKSNLDRMHATLNASRANLENSKARLEQVKAGFQRAEQEYIRSKKLYEQKAISKAEYEQAYSSYLSSKAEVAAANQTVKASEFSVKSSEASLKEADDNLRKTTIYAPMDGTVSMLNVEKGERVVGTIQMAGTELLRIADLNKMEVTVDVNENDIVRVRQNDTAIIEIDAYPDRKFKGIVTEIANSAKNTGVQISTDQVTNFEVKIRILQESYKNLLTDNSVGKYPFRPGMSAASDIRTKTVNQVLCVPIQAVTIRKDTASVKKGKIKKENEPEKDNLEKKQDPFELVFIYLKGKAKHKIVKTGIQDNDYIQIIEGLSEGDEVVTAPYSIISKTLSSGMNIEKTDKDNLFKKEK